MFLNIILPVYNEERRICRGVENTIRYLRSINYSDYIITIVDNASYDSTKKLAEELCLKYETVNYMRLEEKGVGIAFKRGVEKNTCDVVGYMDIDLSTDISHLGDVIKIMSNDKGVMMVNASRWSKKSDTSGRKFYRNISSYGLSAILKIALKMKASDSICGFKFFRRQFVEELISESSNEYGWFYIIELLLRAERKNVKIFELPVKWQDDYDSKVSYFKVIKNYLMNIRRLRKTFRREGIL